MAYRSIAGRRGVGTLAAGVCAILAGCASPEVTEVCDVPRLAGTEKVLFVGAFYDLRSAATARQEPAGAAEPSLLERREVRMPVSEIRSVLADRISRSGLFSRVVNPPLLFAGSTPGEMVDQAQKSSDYLLVAEVNQFHVKSTGFNERGTLALTLDLLFAPVAFITYLTTLGNMSLFCGTVFSCWSAEAVLSVSASVIDVGTGMVVFTARIEERARCPYDGLDAFGNLWDDEDDWVDLGRRLGEVAVQNAGVRLAEEIQEALAGGTPSR